MGVTKIQSKARSLFASLLLLPASACHVSDLDLEARACPCAPGWTCDVAINVCVSPERIRADAAPQQDGEPSAERGVDSGAPSTGGEADPDADASVADVDADTGCVVDCTLPAGDLNLSSTTFVESRPVEVDYSGVMGVVAAFVAVYPESGGAPIERHMIDVPRDGAAAGQHSFGPLVPATYRIRLMAEVGILDEIVVQVLADTDGDGVADGVDGCPQDPAKTAEGGCGCGRADADTDDDGTPDCSDDCPLDPEKRAEGICGCGTPEDSCAGSVRYEAEDASAMVDASVSSANEGHTGTGYVDYGGAGSFAEWDAIDGGSGGTFRVDLRYALLQSSRSCELLVDGVPVATAAFRATGSWTTWTIESHEILLTPGMHTLRIVANGGGGPNLDHVVLTLVKN
jgi:hypothetical protein